MSTCGYVCPLCEGTGLDEKAEPCTWCSATPPPINVSDEEWLASTHEGCGCSDKADTV